MTPSPKVPSHLKTNYGHECYNPAGIVPRAVSMIKEKFPDSIVCTDVALDPYSDQGHDGVVEDGQILNDETVMQLTKQVGVSSVFGALEGCAAWVMLGKSFRGLDEDCLTEL